MKEVTIVIPVCNRAGFLPQLFRSLDKVTYPGLHVILVDNGSEDESLELCRHYADTTLLHVEVLKEPRRGAAIARNTGLRHCRTEWIYFFDSDDELSSDFLDILMPLTDGNDAVFLSTVQVQGKHEKVRACKPVTDASYQILSSMLNTDSMLLRTEWLREIGGWNESLTVWDDWELGVRVLLDKPRCTWYLDKPFHRLYVHGDSLTGPSMSHNVEGKLACLKTVYDSLEEDRHKKALFLRSKIVEGQMRRAGTDVTVRGFDEEQSDVVYHFGRFLSWFTRLGGRGAWRIASWVC